MAKFTFNSKLFLETVNKVVEGVTKKQAQTIAEQTFKDVKEKFLDAYSNHPITQELEAGPNSSSSVIPNGNLFSFIGFNAGDIPAQELYQFFYRNIRLNSKATFINISGGKRRYVYKFSYPGLDAVKEATKINLASNWAPGRSWAISIERGFPGLDHYYYAADRIIRKSRSKHAIQIKGSLGYGTYKRVSYISQLLKILENS